MSSHSPFRRTALILVVATAVIFGLPSCGHSESEAEPAIEDLVADELPTLATIGGAQDVWPFDFGFDSGRAGVRASLGEPTSSELRLAGSENPQAVVEIYQYPGGSFTFFVDEENSIDQLLSAVITDTGTTLRGGLAIGMDVNDALELLGEPGHRDGNRFVFFYYTTTIEIVEANGIVSEVVLSLAMP